MGPRKKSFDKHRGYHSWQLVFRYDWNSVVFVKSGGFHMKTGSFHEILIGLSKERPILGHHAKAHIHEIRWISDEIQWISGEIWQISCGFHLKSARFCADFTWNLVDFMQISPGIHRISWNPADFERPIARNGKPYVFLVLSQTSVFMVLQLAMLKGEEFVHIGDQTWNCCLKAPINCD